MSTKFGTNLCSIETANTTIGTQTQFQNPERTVVQMI
jgi:hypothetical protein